MVIIQEILEKGRGYRGSKSAICESVAVKEQRVDGSYTGPIPVLRCTRFILFAWLAPANLMGFERNYRVKILSNQMNKVR